MCDLVRAGYRTFQGGGARKIFQGGGEILVEGGKRKENAREFFFAPPLTIFAPPPLNDHLYPYQKPHLFIIAFDYTKISYFLSFQIN